MTRACLGARPIGALPPLASPWLQLVAVGLMMCGFLGYIVADLAGTIRGAKAGRRGNRSADGLQSAAPSRLSERW
jgi:hypothetical protein